MIRTVKIWMETDYESVDNLPLNPMSPGVGVALPEYAPVEHLPLDGAKWVYCGAFDQEDVEALNFIFLRNRGKFMKIRIDWIRDIQRMKFQLVVEMHIAELTYEERQARAGTVPTREAPALIGGRRMKLRSEG